MRISQPTAGSSFVSIQALRAIAALLVFAEHAANTLVWEHKIEWFPHVPYGPFGVDLFFVISGFVMVYSSERLFGQPNAPIQFFARRIARIVPLYWEPQRFSSGSWSPMLLRKRSSVHSFSLPTFLRKRLF